MVNKRVKKQENKRTIMQFAFLAITNGYIAGFLEGRIYRGDGKNLCLPGLNCYSCPGALGACPIGAMQAVITEKNYGFPFYVVGFLMMTGAVFGRAICAFMCPFGLFQDLLYKIPFPWKLRRLKGEQYLSKLKYAVLAVFVILMPALIIGDYGETYPWFCKLICPSGTLMAGLPMIALNEGMRDAAGILFDWKIFVLVFLMLLSVVIYRPFCRYLCPLGAIYGLFNGSSLCKYDVDKAKCVSCGICRESCKLDIPVYEKPNSTDCIKCGNCLKSCPHNAINKIGRKL